MRRLLFLLLLPLLLACEPVYGDLATPIDRSMPFRAAAETFMAGDAEMTAMVIFGDQDADNIGDIAYGEVLANGETRLYTGTYVAPEEDMVEATFDVLFFIPYEYDVGATERVGAQTMVLDEPIVYTATLMAGADEAMVDTGSGARTFARLGTLLPNIDLSTMDGQWTLSRLYNYAYVISLSRVIGWGSAGLTMYIGRAGVFDGLQRGRQEVQLRDLLSPKSSFTYFDYTDLTGFRYDGTYESHTDISATGMLLGSVEFSMAGENDGTPIFSGRIEYDNLIVNDGIPNEGFYRFVMDDGQTWDIAAADFHHVDLSGLFP